jgi:hypothetical protein
MINHTDQMKNDTIAAMLRVLAYRVSNDIDRYHAVYSFALAVGDRLFDLTGTLNNPIELGAIALYRKCRGRYEREDCTQALIKYAPELIHWRRCIECNAWGDKGSHLLSCSHIDDQEYT